MYFFVFTTFFGFLMFCSELHSQSLAIDGTFTQEGSTLQFNFKLTLNEKAENIYSGKFEWTLINADRKDPYSFNYFSNRLGLISIEYVNGKYDSITNSLKLIGYKKDDPFEIIGLDEYNSVSYTHLTLPTNSLV